MRRVEIAELCSARDLNDCSARRGESNVFEIASTLGDGDEEAADKAADLDDPPVSGGSSG